MSNEFTREPVRIAVETEECGYTKVVHLTTQTGITVKRFPTQDVEAALQYIKSLLSCDDSNARVFTMNNEKSGLVQQMEEELNISPKRVDPVYSAVKGLHFLLDPTNQLKESEHVASTSTNGTSSGDDVTAASTNDTPALRNMLMGPSNEFSEVDYFSMDDLNAEVENKEVFLKTAAPYIRMGSAWDISDATFAEYKRFVLDTWGKHGENADMYPVLLLTLDDNVACIKVHAPGKGFEIMDLNCRGLATFTGLGSLLTGATNLDELLDLAEKGDYRNVHVTVQPPPSSTKSKTAYDHISTSIKADKPQPSVMFCFGQTEGKRLDELSPEDVAMGLLWQLLHDIHSHVVPLVTAGSGIRHVIAVGRLLERPLVAKWFIKLWQGFCLGTAMFGSKSTEVPLHLLKHGDFVRTLGALQSEH